MYIRSSAGLRPAGPAGGLPTVARPRPAPSAESPVVDRLSLRLVSLKLPESDMPIKLNNTQPRYGALGQGFALTIDDGYQVLVGPNNSGKSSILQLAFNTVIQTHGSDHVALVLPERALVAPTTETGGRMLQNFNGELGGQIATTPMVYDGVRGPNALELPRLLITHTDYVQQLQRLDGYLDLLGLPHVAIKSAQMAHFDDVAIQFHGTGLRSLLSILAALTDPEIHHLLIDEPELSLEPRLQKRVRDLLIDQAENRLILVATHSHLFLNRRDYSANHVVQSTGSLVSVSPIGSQQQLHDLVFDLLGNDTSDLFFPRNYLVVEGPSDQSICERVLRLLAPHDASTLKVLSAGGITRISGLIQAVLDSLLPLIVNDSPYAKRVVALVDAPPDTDQAKVQDLGRFLADRLYILDSPSLEEYLPAENVHEGGPKQG